MLFSNLCMYALLCIKVYAQTSKSDLLRRQYSVVLADIRTLDVDIQNTSKSVSAFNGNTQTAQDYVRVRGIWENDLKKATDNCTSSRTTTFTPAQSQQLTNYLNGFFLSDLTTLITGYNNQKAVFQQAGFGQVVRMDLCRFKARTIKWSDCLVNKTIASQQSAQQAARQKILAQMDRAIATWGQTSCWT